MNLIFYTLYTVCGIYMLLNFKYDLQMFQQNSYRIKRYWKWLKPNLGSTWRIVDLAALFLLFSTLINPVGCAIIVAMLSLVKIIMILRRKSKKPLVFTRRVLRLYSVTAILSIAAVGAVTLTVQPGATYWGSYSGSGIILGTIFLVCILSWGFVIVADMILMPVERLINRHYVNDAKRILKSVRGLRVVGITGSYGKTSTKHYLTHILSEEYDVLMTPGSYNTPMGVVRTIREMMKPYTQIFVCEMGAKQTGDIKEICDIVNPEMGIVTAVGPMHLESFKTIDNVRNTKFELVDSLPSTGVAVINNDFPEIAGREVTNTEAIRYGVTNPQDCDYKAENVSYTPEGTTFTVSGPDGFKMEVGTRLLGECNVSDLLAAIIIALRLGVGTDKIRYAISTIEQVEHRLSIRKTPGGVTVIDDAFNSNPAGSRMAVEVLAQFNKTGKRIIVTPGMIELGSEQERLNMELGKQIGLHVDIAIIVGRYNRESLVKGIMATEFNKENLYEVGSFNEAQEVLGRIMRNGDTVLYENDLPDTFK